jgi:hypothetical protein
MRLGKTYEERVVKICRTLPLFSTVLAAIFLVSQASSAVAQQNQKKSQPRSQYTVPSDQEHWLDRSCANFNT